MLAINKFMIFTDRLFIEAERRWDLDKLYRDISLAKQLIRSAKKAELTSTEKAIFRGLLCNYSPQEIATYLCWSSVSLRVELTRGLYRYIETATAHELNTIKNWRNVSLWLEEAGYKSVRSETDGARD